MHTGPTTKLSLQTRKSPCALLDAQAVVGSGGIARRGVGQDLLKDIHYCLLYVCSCLQQVGPFLYLPLTRFYGYNALASSENVQRWADWPRSD